MRYLIKFSYDGSKFYGFQRQKDKKSVQKDLEDALKIFSHEDVEIKGAGRTDRKVHAYMQCAHFDLKKNMDVDRLLYLLNRKTSPYLSVLSCETVNDDFHARFNVKEKTYIYKIKVGSNSPFDVDYYLFYNNLDLKKLKKVARVFEGVHDFRNFVSGERENYTAIIYSVKVKKDKDIVTLTFRGKSFYRYMVRNLVGAMLDYEKGKVDIKVIQNMLDKPEERKQLSTAPAQGLYLKGIKY